MVSKTDNELLLSGALSRTYIEDSDGIYKGEIETHVGMNVENLPLTSEIIKKFQIKTERLTSCHEVVRYDSHDGCPVTKSNVLSISKSYNFLKGGTVCNKRDLFLNFLICTSRKVGEN